MTRPLRCALVAMLAAMVMACGRVSSPSAPSPVASAPSPVAAANVAGTWVTEGGTAFMALAQAGDAINGAQLPVIAELGGLLAVTSGTVMGHISDTDVTLSMHAMVTVTKLGDTMTCRGGDTFAGRVSGDMLTGIYISGTTRYVCDRQMPLPTPQVSGPMTFTRQ